MYEAAFISHFGISSKNLEAKLEGGGPGGAQLRDRGSCPYPMISMRARGNERLRQKLEMWREQSTRLSHASDKSHERQDARLWLQRMAAAQLQADGRGFGLNGHGFNASGAG